MVRAALAALTALLLALGLPPQAVASEGGDEGPGGDRQGPSERSQGGGAGTSSGGDAEDVARGRDRGHDADDDLDEDDLDEEDDLHEARGASPGERPRVNVTGSSVVGRHVTFQLDEAACALRDVTVRGVLVAREVAIVNGTNGTFRQSGAHLELRCQGGELSVNDNPTAGLDAKPDTRAGRSRWALSPLLRIDPDYNAMATEGGSITIYKLTGPNLTALLRLRSEERVGASGFTANEAQLVARGPNHLLPDVANRHRDEILDAQGRGHVGAEITLLPGPGQPVAEVLAAENLTLDVTPREGGVRVVLNGTVVGGKTIVLNLAQGLLRGERVVVSFYDEVNGTFYQVPIAEAQLGLADVLDPNDDSGPEYWVVQDKDGAQVLLSIPHFSTKAFEVQSLPFVGEVTPSVLMGLLGGALLVAVAGAGLVRRPKAKQP